MIIGLGAKPPAPATGPTRTTISPSSMLMTWPQVTVSDLPVLGYVLQVDDGLGGDFATVYDGALNPQTTAH